MAENIGTDIAQGQTAGGRATADLTAALRSRQSLIWIVTREESRVCRSIFEAASVARYAPRYWCNYTGVTEISGEPIDRSATEPLGVLNAVRDTRDRSVYVLRDFPRHLADPFTLRGLRSLATTLPAAPRDEARAMIVVSPSKEVPPELTGLAVVVEWPLPDRTEIGVLLDAQIATLPPEIRTGALPDRDAAIDAAVGLTSDEAIGCFKTSLVKTRKVDPASVAADKRKVVAGSGLEWIDAPAGGIDAIGGLDGLKGWITARAQGFSQEARDYGLPAPKGVLLVGVPGCGKSLTAKIAGTVLGMPVLRLDMGGAKSKFVGESEANLRRALKVAESIGCVLWIDEIEKAMQGATSGSSDGGVSSDALGTLLSFMQERTGNVFVIATANDVSGLPPELLRKGRFDELFFVDLPTRTERASVLRAALRGAKRNPATIDVAAVAQATEGFAGAEIAALVPDALFASFADGKRALRTADLTECAARTVPLSKTAPEKVARLREWAKGKARLASLPETAAAGAGGLDL
jgi:MoxR-like ATPase